MNLSRRIAAFSLLALGSCGAPDATRSDILVYHAHSLSIPMQEIAAEFEAQHPQFNVELQPGGSNDLARRVSELDQPSDIFAAADYEAIENLLIPKHASWYISFASNEIVLAYRPNLPAERIPDSANWPDLLLDPALTFGRSDPDSEPIGYRTILAIKLAERHLARPGLAEKILDKDSRSVRPNPAALIAMLETGALDYAFVYRNMAMQQNVPFLSLPPEMNLGDPTRASTYAQASVEIAGARPGETMTVVASPIVYALTIPAASRNPDAAQTFLQFFLSPEGGLAALERHHLKPIAPVATPYYDALPDTLKPYARLIDP